MFDILGRQPSPFLVLGAALPHLSALVHQTWPMALVSWLGLRLFFRSTGKKLNLVGNLPLLGAVWGAIVLLYSRLGLEGSAIVHALAFSFLVLGCLGWIADALAGGSRLR